jgi:hypothetical protein
MRSERVFLALDRVPNPYFLCHFVRLWTRKFHKDGEVHTTINTALKKCGMQNLIVSGLQANTPPPLDHAWHVLEESV